MSNIKNTTVIYITANTEDKKFESKIIKQIRANAGGLPIISVSRLPIKLGKNICVGTDVTICDSSLKRQFLKGLQAAETEYALIATAGHLYPPEYFTFTPPATAENIVYRYGNVWTLGGKYWKNRYSENAQMCNRYFWIKMLTKAMAGHKGWKPFTVPPVFTAVNLTSFTSDNPVVRLITENDSQKFVNVNRHVLPQRGLPYWGAAEDLKTKMGV